MHDTKLRRPQRQVFQSQNVSIFIAKKVIKTDALNTSCFLFKFKHIMLCFKKNIIEKKVCVVGGAGALYIRCILYTVTNLTRTLPI